jgi:hypothetical protein
MPLNTRYSRYSYRFDGNDRLEHQSPCAIAAITDVRMLIRNCLDVQGPAGPTERHA